jgi:hypothetical protein
MVLLAFAWFMVEEQPQQQKKNQDQVNDGGDCLGNSDSDHDDCDQVLCVEFENRRKKERVLSGVFKRVIGE